MTCKLSKIAEIRAGLQTRESLDYQPVGTHSILQVRDFNDEKTALLPGKELAKISPGTVSPETELSLHDVVFLAKGQHNFAFHCPLFSEPTLAASYFFVIRCGDSLLPEFLTWFLNRRSTRKHLKRIRTSGTHMPVVRRDDLETLRVPVPPIDAQRRIIEIQNLADEEAFLLSKLARQRAKIADALCDALINPIDLTSLPINAE